MVVVNPEKNILFRDFKRVSYSVRVILFVDNGFRERHRERKSERVTDEGELLCERKYIGLHMYKKWTV